MMLLIVLNLYRWQHLSEHTLIYQNYKNIKNMNFCFHITEID